VASFPHKNGIEKSPHRQKSLSPSLTETLTPERQRKIGTDLSETGEREASKELLPKLKRIE
jgi:hypothetical protein